MIAKAGGWTAMAPDSIAHHSFHQQGYSNSVTLLKLLEVYAITIHEKYTIQRD